jgi:hypothetical protein
MRARQLYVVSGLRKVVKLDSGDGLIARRKWNSDAPAKPQGCDYAWQRAAVAQLTRLLL